MNKIIGDENQNSSGVATESPRPPLERGRCWGAEFCPHPGEPCIDGCHYCGRRILVISGDHDHVEYETGRYSCVCETC